MNIKIKVASKLCQCREGRRQTTIYSYYQKCSNKISTEFALNFLGTFKKNYLKGTTKLKYEFNSILNLQLYRITASMWFGGKTHEVKFATWLTFNWMSNLTLLEILSFSHPQSGWRDCALRSGSQFTNQLVIKSLVSSFLTEKKRKRWNHADITFLMFGDCLLFSWKHREIEGNIFDKTVFL